jgi:hypothetical protein
MLLTCIAIALLTWALVKVHSHMLDRQNRKKHRSPRECRSLIAGKELPGLRSNQLTLYESRSLPNRRHLRAFNIENTFNTSNASYAQGFADESKKPINLTSAH